MKAMKMNRWGGIALTAALGCCLLSGCAAPSAEFEPNAEEIAQTIDVTEAPTGPVEEISMVVTPDTISQLEQYPSLRIADLTGSTCYAEIESYARRHPEVEVLYSITLGGMKYSPEVTEVSFEDGLYNLEELLETLPHLRRLRAVNFQGETPPRAVLAQLQAALPEVDIRYSVRVAGMVCDGGAEELDLSFMDSSMVPSVADQLTMMPNLRRVELLDASGRTGLTIQDVQTLQAAMPNTVFHYTFPFFGRTVSTTDDEIVFTGENLAQQPNAEYELRQALSILRGCRRVVLDNCGFSNELLAQLRDEYRHVTKLVWRVWFAKDGSCLTDREMIRSTFNLTDSNCHDLMYCEDVKYFDMGHNEQLYTIDFVAYMPNLVAVIVSGAPITDLTPFAGCQKLEFLEVAFCGYVKDISPLAECYSLERLNIGFTKVSDISVLDDKNMYCLVDTNTRVSNADRNRFEKLHPDCMVQHSGAQPYGHPWRYLADKLTFNEYYQMLRDVFDYENGTNTHY